MDGTLTSRLTRRLALGGLVAAGVWLSGCETPLFPKTAERSPFDRYHTLRGQERAATEQIGPMGAERPLLRERLKPLGSP